MSQIHAKRLVWIWLTVWVATRALIVGDVGFWHDAGPRLQDVNNYEVWSHYLTANHAIPGGESWQYPPGAAYLMLLPRLGLGTYGESFVGLMLLVDFAGLALLALLGRRSGNYTGVWVWLLGMPLLGTFSVLRFDLVPAVIGIAALVVIHRRPNWFGLLAGLGASIKLWPIVLLFGEWDRRRLIHALTAALGTIALVVVISTLAFDDSTSFLGEQSGRGLQEEAVATVPWHVQAIVTGETPVREIRSGAWEIASPGADTVASLLEGLTVAALGAAAAWWWYRARAIRAGRVDLAGAAVSRDFVFTIVLLLVVTSRVLSPQFMAWLLGLSAVILTAGSTRLARPAWLVLGGDGPQHQPLQVAGEHRDPGPGPAGRHRGRSDRDDRHAAGAIGAGRSSDARGRDHPMIEGGRAEIDALAEKGALREDADRLWATLQHFFLIWAPLAFMPVLEQEALDGPLLDEAVLERWVTANVELLEGGLYR